jgi:ArsR family metal-binding transcriptional regulator
VLILNNELTTQIHDKGFDMSTPARDDSLLPPTTDFSKLKVGLKTLEDAQIKIGTLKKINPRLADKEAVLRAINSGDVNTMIDISNFFANVSGIYSRLIKHLSNFYRYDWLITPYTSGAISSTAVIAETDKKLLCLDNFKVKKFFG